ncbi:hypothetical protein MBLNU457_3336t1 [Dothideomycetes sp. NU457]
MLFCEIGQSSLGPLGRILVLLAAASFLHDVSAQGVDAGHGIADYINLGLGVKDVSVASFTMNGNDTWTTTGCASFTTPGPLTIGRFLCPTPPCQVFCVPGDTTCLSSGFAAAATCSPQWKAYNSASSSFAQQHTNTDQWVDQTLSMTFTQTSTEWSSTSTADSIYSSPGQLAVTPVYVFGSAQTDTTTTSTYQTITAPPTYSAAPPCCQVTQVITEDCLQCSINGGTVRLLYWPPNTRNTTENMTAVPSVITTLGTTLTSPTVYISFQTVFAENLCTVVGSNHTGSIIGLAPQDVSTIYGNLLAKSFSYRQIDYNNLATSQVPISVYEEQPFCGGHCTTILPEYHPTLSMPPQIRSLDAAWGDCDLALYGIYDPPLALTPVANIVVPTAPTDYAPPSSTSPSQAASATHTAATATALADNAGSASTTDTAQQTQSGASESAGNANSAGTTGSGQHQQSVGSDSAEGASPAGTNPAQQTQSVSSGSADGSATGGSASTQALTSTRNSQNRGSTESSNAAVSTGQVGADTRNTAQSQSVVSMTSNVPESTSGTNTAASQGSQSGSASAAVSLDPMWTLLTPAMLSVLAIIGLVMV